MAFMTSSRVFCRRLFATQAQARPWFVTEPETPTLKLPHTSSSDVWKPSETETEPVAPELPKTAPLHLKILHAELAQSPHLDRSYLSVAEPESFPPGPPLPPSPAKGRRKRGRTDVGQGVPELPSRIWDWVVTAQVKEGTENRGAIESVVRLVRKTLLKADPPLPLPPNSKRRMYNGWAMIDAGNFAVHIFSRDAREKYFTRRDW